MALKSNTNKTIDEIIDQLIEDELFIHNYTTIENMAKSDYDAKLTVKIGKKINKSLETILQSEEGRIKFEKLLQHKDPFIRFIGARYLYPLNPSLYIKEIIKYKNSISDALEIASLNNLIEGLKNKQEVFMIQFKKLYGSENLEDIVLN